MRNKELHRVAMRKAYKIRRQNGIARDAPLCVFDLAQHLDIEVRFRPEKSLEGLYLKSQKPTILISTHRPPGRQSFNCAHELGHHFFNHGTKVDEFVGSCAYGKRKSQDEVLADSFAGSLLMPLPAIERIIKLRKINFQTCSSLEIYKVANNLGVGYDTLISHLQWSLRLITPNRANLLRKTQPKEIHQIILPGNSSDRVVPVDKAWEKVSIDLRIDDLISLPFQVKTEGGSIFTIRDHHKQSILQASRVGISRIESIQPPEWSSFIRVSKKEYVGRSIFRHEEDPDE